MTYPLLTLCLLCLTGLTVTEFDCPTQEVNVAWSESLGCVWADDDETHRFDSYEDALQICK